MDPFDIDSETAAHHRSDNGLHDYAEASRLQALDAEARGNMPLARELKARAAEAEELERQRP